MLFMSNNERYQGIFEIQYDNNGSVAELKDL